MYICPMCAEYEQPGINGTQKMMKCVEVVYNEVKKHKDIDIWKSVDLVSEFHLLSIPIKQSMVKQCRKNY